MKNWKNIVVSPDDTIMMVLEKINTNGSQFVLVADNEFRLLGTATDGDIRRGLIKGIQLHNSVSEIMKKDPLIFRFGSKPAELQRFMKAKDINHLPLVDEKNFLKDVVTLKELLVVSKKENVVILMAGGLGTRLASLTENCPKPMLKIGGKPILETIVEIFKEHGFYRFVISLNYKSEMIESYFGNGEKFDVEISYLKEDKRLGTAGALSLYNPLNDLPFIVMNGDLLTKLNFSDLINFHLESKKTATMCLRQYDHQIPFGVVTTNDEQIVKIEEKPLRSYLVNGGIYVITPNVLPQIPKDTFLDMPTFFEGLIEAGKSVGAYPFYEYWIDIGRIADLEKAHYEFVEIFK